jgi:hypothetical protein
LAAKRLVAVLVDTMLRGRLIPIGCLRCFATDAVSHVFNIRQERQAVLAELARIAQDEFHGCVTRNMITGLYIAQRRL